MVPCVRYDKGYCVWWTPRSQLTTACDKWSTALPLPWISLPFFQTNMCVCVCVCVCVWDMLFTHQRITEYQSLFNCAFYVHRCVCVFSDRIHVVAAQQHALQSQQRETNIGKARWGEAGDFVYSIWPPPQCGYVQNLSLWTTHFSTAKLGCVGVCFCKSRPLKQLLNLGLIYCS